MGTLKGYIEDMAIRIEQQDIIIRRLESTIDILAAQVSSITGNPVSRPLHSPSYAKPHRGYGEREPPRHETVYEPAHKPLEYYGHEQEHYESRPILPTHQDPGPRTYIPIPAQAIVQEGEYIHLDARHEKVFDGVIEVSDGYPSTPVRESTLDEEIQLELSELHEPGN
jgi:hypothetical protein